MYYYLLLVAGLFVYNAQAAIYTWRDKQQIIHFSDRPEQGATLVELVPNPPSPTLSQSTPPISAVAVAHHVPDRELTIDYPQDEATIYDNQGYITVQISLKPALQVGDQLLFWLDGTLLERMQTTQLSLTNLDRGEHTLQVQLQDQQGNIVLTSKAVRFYLHRTSLQPS